MRRRLDRKPFAYNPGIINEAFSSEENINDKEYPPSPGLYPPPTAESDQNRTDAQEIAADGLETVKIYQGSSSAGKIGIKLKGGVDSPVNGGRDAGIFIQCIMPGSLAEGKLLPGDRLLSINGVQTTNITRSAAVHLLRKATRNGHVLTLTIERLAMNKELRADTLRFRIPSLRQQWFQELEAVFHMYDRGRGKIRTRDFRKALRLCGHDAPEPEVHFYMTELGLIGNKKLTFTDFVRLMSEIVSEEEHGNELLRIYGVHQDHEEGFITNGDDRAFNHIETAHS